MTQLYQQEGQAVQETGQISQQTGGLQQTGAMGVRFQDVETPGERAAIQGVEEALEVCGWCADQCIQLADPSMIECIRLCEDVTELAETALAMLPRRSQHAETVLQAFQQAAQACMMECGQHQHAHCQDCAETLEFAIDSVQQYFATTGQQPMQSTGQQPVGQPVSQQQLGQPISGPQQMGPSVGGQPSGQQPIGQQSVGQQQQPFAQQSQPIEQQRQPMAQKGQQPGQQSGPY